MKRSLLYLISILILLNPVYSQFKNLTKQFESMGAKIANSSKELAEKVDLIITCLPSPEICAEVMEGDNGILEGISENKIWLEMSTTDEAEVKRIGKKIIE